MQNRIATIVTAFRATGLRAVRSSISIVTKTVQGASRIISGLGDGLKTRVFSSLVVIIDRIAAASKRAAVAGAKMTATLAKGAAVAAKNGAKIGIAGAVAGATSLAGRAAFVGKAAMDNLEDLTPLRQMASLLGVDIQLMSAFQLYAEKAGVATEDLTQIMSGFAAAVGDASDPTSEVAKKLAAIGISVRDAKGQMKPMLALFQELATVTKRMGPSQRNAILNPIFGDDDSLKVSMLLDKLAKDGAAGIRKDVGQSFADGLVVTQEDIELNARFARSLLGIQRVWKVFKRELFNAFEPVITGFIRLGTALFSGKMRMDVITKLFVTPFNKLSRIVNEILKVFFGINSKIFEISRGWQGFQSKMWVGTRWKLGWTYELKDLQKLKYPWLIEVRAGLTVIAGLVKGTLILLGKIAVAGKDAAIALNQAADGPGLWEKFKEIKTDDVVAGFRRMGEAVAAFGRDLRRLSGIGLVDPTQIETGLARGLLAGGVKLKSVAVTIMKPVEDRLDALEGRITGAFTRVRDVILRAWAEANVALQSGQGLKSVDSSLGQIIYLAGFLLTILVGVVRAIEAIAKGQPVGSDFAWVEQIYNGIKYAFESLKQFKETLEPVKKMFEDVSKALFGINAVVTFLIAGALLKFLNMLIACVKQLVLLYTTVASSAFITAFKTAFDAAKLAGATTMVALRAGFAAMWTAMAAAAAPFVAVLAVILAAVVALAAALGLIVAVMAKLKSMKQEEEFNKQLKDSRKYDSEILQSAMNRNKAAGVSPTAGFNPQQLAYLGSAEYQADLKASAAAPRVDSAGRPVKIYFGGEEQGELTGYDDQIDRLQRSAAQALGGI